MKQTHAQQTLAENDAPVLLAVIKSVQTTGAQQDGGYAASQVSYTVDVILPGGGVETIAGVVPANNRPPETVNITPCPVNSLILGIRNGLNVLFYIVEYPVLGACP